MQNQIYILFYSLFKVFLHDLPALLFKDLKKRVSVLTGWKRQVPPHFPTPGPAADGAHVASWRQSEDFREKTPCF